MSEKLRKFCSSILNFEAEIQWQVKSEWENTEIWKVKGEKVMDINTGSSPGYQSQSQ